MGELLATLVWVAGMYFCGVLIEGGGLDMEAHERFYCRPPSQGRGQQQQSDGR